MKLNSYKYYSPSYSRHMLPALDRHLSKIGTPQVVEARSVGRGFKAWYGLVVRGTTGKLVLKGCSWGYRGEGSHATRDVLVRLGVHESLADASAFRSQSVERMEQGQLFWKLNV